MMSKNRITRTGFVVWAWSLVSALGFPVEAEKRRPYFTSQLGRRPPELVSRDEHWINAKKKLTLRQLHGQVIWLEFNF